MSFVWKSSITVALALSLAACGGSVETTDAPPAEKAAPVEKVKAQVPDASNETATPVTPASVEGSPEFADLPEPYASADYARGRSQFRTCSTCHHVKSEAGNLVGPNLHGMFDRKAGELDGFGYSKALREADFQWTPEKLDEWLANPRGFLPGNNMSFTGVRREKYRQAVIAYLLVETKK